MKLKRIFVAVENKSGGMYQVPLSMDHQAYVIDLIVQLHGGTIKVRRSACRR